MCEQQHLFLTHGCPGENVEVFETENVSNQMELEPLTLEFIPNAPPVELPGSVICYPMFWNTGSGGIDIFVYKFNSWNINCLRATAFIFDSRTDALEKVSTFFQKKTALTQTGIELPTFGFMYDCSNNWATGGNLLLSHVLEYWLWQYRCFCL